MRRTEKPRRSRLAVVTAFMVVMVAATGCGTSTTSGVELGHLRDLARRVEGGGAECPLAIPDSALRPSTANEDEPIVPLRVDGPGALGVVGTKGATKGNVRITCRFQAGALSVTLDVAGVPRGDAVAEFADVLGTRGDGSVVLTFIAEHRALPVGRAQALPGKTPASFTRVTAAKGDVAIILSVDRLDASASLPPQREVDQNSLRIARSLAE